MNWVLERYLLELLLTAPPLTQSNYTLPPLGSEGRGGAEWGGLEKGRYVKQWTRALGQSARRPSVFLSFLLLPLHSVNTHFSQEICCLWKCSI